jgi:protein-tyrosine-phosphatase
MSTVQAPRRSVLFVDESNTRLSFMAEQVARARWGEGVRVASAGYDARESAPSERALTSLETWGIVPAPHRPQHLREVDAASFEVVVALSRGALDKLPSKVRRRAVAWAIADPWQGSDAAYHAVLGELAAAVDRVFAEADDRRADGAAIVAA